jgi:hypothetical protein
LAICAREVGDMVEAMKIQRRLCQVCPGEDSELELLSSRVRSMGYEVDLRCRRCGRFWIGDVRPSGASKVRETDPNPGFASAFEVTIVNVRPRPDNRGEAQWCADDQSRQTR